MKKLVMLLFVLASVLILVGCSAQKTSTERTTPSPTQVQETSSDAAVNELANIEQDINFDELEAIEKDLDLGL